MSIDTIWYTRCPVPSAATIAIGEGWLDREFAGDGIKVRSLATSADRRLHRTHYNHAQDSLFRFGGPIPPLIARGNGGDVKVIGLGWIDRSGGIYVPDTSPHRGEAALKGLRLSVPRRLNDPIDWWRASVLGGYERVLRLAGLTLDDVTLVDVAIGREFAEDATVQTGSTRSLWGARSQFAVQREELAALARGEVDAIYTDGAMGALVRAFAGLRPLKEFHGSEKDPIDGTNAPVVLTVSGNLLRDRNDLVVRWLRQLLRAPAWTPANIDRSRYLVARDSGVPEDFVEDSYSPHVFDQIDVTLDPTRIARLKARHAVLAKSGVAGEIDFDAFIDPAPLAQAQAHMKFL